MGSKKPFWKKALRVVAYAAGAALIAAGVIAAIGFSGGAAAPFVGIACGAIASTPWLAATVAAGATALGFTAVGGYFASRSKKNKVGPDSEIQVMRSGTVPMYAVSQRSVGNMISGSSFGQGHMRLAEEPSQEMSLYAARKALQKQRAEEIQGYYFRGIGNPGKLPPVSEMEQDRSMSYGL